MRNPGGSLKIVFAELEGETDLQGLARIYDTNRDGVLDLSDEKFASFGIWQDRDSDGFLDEDEFLTLIEAAIASINLNSNGESRLEADGDVLVHGQTWYTKVDGSTFVAEDVSFVAIDTSVSWIATLESGADSSTMTDHGLLDQPIDFTSSDPGGWVDSSNDQTSQT